MLPMANLTLVSLDSRFQTSTYVHVSSAALLISDWFFTLELEVTYAWNPPWNMGTVLFFLTRYLVFVDTFISLCRQLMSVMSASMCTFVYMAEGWLIGFGILIAELILTIRVWAIWGQTRNIKILLITISMITASAGAIGYIFYGTTFTSNKIVDISPTLTAPTACFHNNADAALQWAYVALLVHQTLISTMTVVKGVQHYRTGSYQTSLIYTFYEDSVSYYAATIVLSIVNLVMLHYESGLLISTQRVLHSLLTARMLLNLRQEAATLHVIGKDSKYPVPKPNIMGGSIAIPDPVNWQSRVEGWFGNSARQQHMRTDLEV